ncbi:MAG: DUF2090 domain-containing protein [Candidatus Levybacteria bacterium]|nr:DUF2090 domain-containing protein [Candidatus Levybacteria bacterium]
MNNNLGYNKKLFILPFDHRASFAKMFGFVNLSDEEKDYIKSCKQIIYEAFKKSILQGISKDESAILVDEEYGDAILKDAKDQGFTTILTTEKSGNPTFDFEYEDQFGEHIEKYKPTFAKALIRYKQNADWTKLKILSDYCHKNNYKFLLEVLSGLDIVKSESLISIINELRQKRIEPDVWKLEGMENKNEYEAVIEKIQEDERINVELVILGRGENKEKVEQWINAGRLIKGVIGFAIGRTVFSKPLIEFKSGKISREETISQIANNFKHFYDIFQLGRS